MKKHLPLLDAGKRVIPELFSKSKRSCRELLNTTTPTLFVKQADGIAVFQERISRYRA